MVFTGEVRPSIVNMQILSTLMHIVTKTTEQNGNPSLVTSSYSLQTTGSWLL